MQPEQTRRTGQKALPERKMAPLTGQQILLGTERRFFRPKPGMHRIRGGFSVIAAIILTASPAWVQDVVPACHARSVDVDFADETAMRADASGASLCLSRGPTTAHLEVSQTSIAAILSALAGAYKISYRSSVPLSELRSGIYAGPVSSVISDVLDGYDFAIRHENSNIDVMVFNKSGGQPMPGPQPVAAQERINAGKTRPAPPVSRTH
jgi:hypothetical protein